MVRISILSIIFSDNLVVTFYTIVTISNKSEIDENNLNS